jgi:hypothetical protein
MTEKFAHLATWVALMSGHPAAFVFAILTVVAWMVTGPLFSYSDTWQLVMNTWTNVATFLMVFLSEEFLRWHREPHAGGGRVDSAKRRGAGAKTIPNAITEHFQTASGQSDSSQDY